MKKPIINIAGAELRIMFYSPIAWIVLVIFVFQVNAAYLDCFQDLIKSKAMGYGLRDVTDALFNGWKGVYTKLLPDLYLYIPLLTMGLISRELSNGSIKLLYSSPVTESQIVLGKYLAIVSYCFIFLSIFLVLGLFSMIFVKSAGVGVILSGLLGFFLLICTYAAIGLFISSMTSYQVVAAIGTLAILAILNLIGGVGQDVEWVRNITYWLSLSDRTTDIIKGLIASDDVIYFIAISGLFIALTITRLKLNRQRKSHVNSIMRYGIVICVFVGVGYFSSMPRLTVFHDATSTKSLTLTPASQKVVSELKGDMTITTYVNLLAKYYYYALPANVNNDLQLFKQYRRFKPDIKMKYVYYYDHSPNQELENRFAKTPDITERATIVAKGHRLRLNMFKSPEEMRDIADLSAEEHRFVRRIDMADGRSAFLRIFDDMNTHPSEREITAAMKRLTGNIPVVGFLTGHGERSILKYGDGDYFMFASQLPLRASLKNQGFDTKEIFLKEGQGIPADISILVISDVGGFLQGWETDAVRNYIDGGGNLIIAVEPDRQEYVEPLTDMLGISFGHGVIVRNDNFEPDVIPCKFTPEVCRESGRYAYLNSLNAKVMLKGATWIDYGGASAKGFAVLPVITPDSTGYWNEMETVNLAENTPAFNAQAGERMLNDPAIIVNLMREVNGRRQSVLVLGDADCISNGQIVRSYKNVTTANYDVILESFRWFTDGEFPVNTARAAKPDNDIQLSSTGIKISRVIFLGLLPVLLIFAGGIKVIKRIRK